ncbi:MAG: DUF1499 domain-containing protein [Pseudomonadota bacterium]
MTLQFDRVQLFLTPGPAPGSALWATRIAVFSAGLVIAGLFMHRLFSLPTPVALNLIKLSILGAAFTIVLGAFALVRIWRTGCRGTSRVMFSGLLALGLLAWPLAQLPKMNALPEINDLTTDLQNPPVFDVLAQARPSDANSTTYPGVDFSERQKAAYPDLKTLWVNRSGAEAYEIAQEALKRQGLQIVRAAPPGQTVDRPGVIEAYDRTLVLGFYDDVVVRVMGNSKSARIDLRSASRYGRHDLGRNAQRIRRLLGEVNARLEATVPAEGGR